MKNTREVIKLATSTHKPFDTRIFHKEAISLNNAGYKVTFIVPWYQEYAEQNISIKAVSMPKNGREKQLKTPFHIYKKALQQNKDAVFHCHDSELLLIAIFLSLKGRKVVYDAHEDTPLQISYQHWIPSYLKWVFKIYYYFLEKIAGWLFDGIIIAEPVIGKYFPAKKTVLVRNFPIFDNYEQHEPIPFKQKNNWITYIGSITEVRGAKNMIEAMAYLSNDLELTFKLGGRFHPPGLYHDLMKLKGWKRVDFMGYVQREELEKTLAYSKIGIIIPKPVPRYKTNYPVKLFEYMAAGIPVIASKYGEAAKFVEEAQCGILVEPEDPRDIANAIEKLLSNPEESENMGKRGRELIKNKYNWKVEENKLLEFYKRL